MAIIVEGGLHSGTNASTYTSTGISITNGALGIICVIATGTTLAAPTLTDSAGGTFTLIGSTTKNGGADTLYFFVADQLGTGLSRTYTFDCTGDAATSCSFTIIAITGWGGSLGSAAVQQTAVSANQAAGGTPAITFGSAVNTANRVIAFVANAANPAALTPPASPFTELDDSGNASPVTGLEVVAADTGFTSATVTWGGTSGTAFGVFGAELTELAAGALTETLTDSLNNWSDFAGAGYGNLHSDQLIITDSLGLGYGAILSDNLNNWADSTLNITLEFQVQINQNMNNWADTLNVGYGFHLTDNMGTLVDGTVDLQGQWQLVIIDSTLNNWADVLAFTLSGGELSLTLSDNLNNWADSLLAGYGAAMSDQLVILDSMSLGYGLLLSDNLNNWADSIALVFGFNVALSDNLNNWQDALAIGYGNVLSDNLNNWSDFVAAGYGALMSDQLVITDSLGAGYGLILSDSLNFWADELLFDLVGTQIVLHLSDSLDNWVDSMLAGYGTLFSDQLVILDSMSLGYGLLLSDDLNNWTDSAVFELGMILALSDDLNNWADQMLAGYGMSMSDQLVILDSLSAGYGLLLSDDLNFWQDALTFQLIGAQIQISLADDLNFWQDSLLAGYGAAMSDQLVILDSMSLGYGLLLSDSLNFWNDALLAQLSIALTLTDNLNNWADQLLAGYGAALSDQLVILDSMGLGYGLLLSDDLNFWQDAFALQLIGAQIQISLSDNLNFWADALFAGYGASMSDQLVITDSLGLGYGLLLSDSLSFWLDSSTAVLGLLRSFSDNLNNWTDSLTAGYGLNLIDHTGTGFDTFNRANEPLTAKQWWIRTPGAGSSPDIVPNVIANEVGVGVGQTGGVAIWAQSPSWSTRNWCQARLTTISDFAAQIVVALTGSLGNVFGYFIGYDLFDPDSQNNLRYRIERSTATTFTNLAVSASVSAQPGDELYASYDSTTGEIILKVNGQVVLQVTDPSPLPAGGTGVFVATNTPTNAHGFLDDWATGPLPQGPLDSLTVGYGALMSDQLVMVDSLGAGYGLILSDSLNFWQDSATINLISIVQLNLAVADDLNFWQDQLLSFLGVGVGLPKIRTVKTYLPIQITSMRLGPQVNIRKLYLGPKLTGSSYAKPGVQ